MRIRVERLIPASPERVFACLASPENQPEWMIEVAAVEMDGAAEPGGRFRQLVDIRGAASRLTYEFEITERVEMRLFEYCSVGGRYPTAMRYELEPVGGGTRVVATEDSSPPGIRYLVLRPVVKWVIRRRLAGDLKDLEAKLGADSGGGE